MIVHVVNEETPGQRKSISGVSLHPQHIPAKLKTTSLIDQGPRVYTNTSELRQRTLMTESKKDERENMTNDAVTVITCTNHRQLRLFSYTVVKNEDFQKNNIFLDYTNDQFKT